ncbi:hypothetical protein MMC06_004989 [Schaereria dolodes]|nr:hypothetical protein [Schaereria dolodes]
MSSAAEAAVLYAVTISPTSLMGTALEEAKDKQHHLQDGKGFTNPWDSWKRTTGATFQVLPIALIPHHRLFLFEIPLFSLQERRHLSVLHG